MKVKVIYLAAGNSRRFGSNKLLYELDGMQLYLHLLNRLLEICERHEEWEVIVVTQYQSICDEAGKMGIRAVFSPESHRGASYSVKAGLHAAAELLAEETGACAFFAADQPYLTEESAECFLREMERRGAKLGCVMCEDYQGNPAWFSKKYFAELEELEGDQGGKRVLRKHQQEVLYFTGMDKNELRDIDFISDIL